MSTIRTSVICDRVRAQISLELDGELSQLERAMVAAHLGRCAECRAYQDEVVAFTALLREAPAEPMATPVSVRRPRRSYVGRVQAGIAAAAAVAALGIATQVSEQAGGVSSPGSMNIRYPSLGQLQREQALLQHARTGKRLQLDGFVL